MPGHFVNGVKSAIQEEAKKFPVGIVVDSNVPKEKKCQGNTVSGWM